MKTKFFDGKAPPGGSLRRAVRALFCLLIITACLAGAVSAADTTWYSADISEFTLTTADELAGLAQLVNGGNNFADKTVKLGGDINLNNEEWTPIGNETNSFQGTFDGDGKTVSGLNITQKGDGYLGLFGYNKGSIKNLNVDGTIFVDLTSAINYVYAGGIVGRNEGGTISNSSSSVTVDVTAKGYVYAGGIVGQNGPGTISNCYATGDVKAKSTGANFKDAFSGGIAGSNSITTSGSGNYANISHSYATGDVNATSDEGSARAGGITGLNYVSSSGGNANISHSYATGDVNATSVKGPAHAGGIAGKNDVEGSGDTAKISNCYALNKEITAAGSADIDIGRVVGYDGTGTLSGNYGWAGMKLNENPVTGTATDGNGADVAGSAVWNKNDGFGQFTSENGWKLNDDGNENFLLPVLAGLAAPANADASHLNPVGKTYTITFENTGDSTIAPISLAPDSAVTAPADPTKTGYTFDGWDKEIPAIMPEYDVTVTAQWTINQYTITFNTDGGSAVAPITQDYGTDVTKPAAPTKTGYTFTGWDTEIPATMPANDMTIKAQWTAHTYTVKFHNNTGSGTMEDQTFTYGETEALNASTFTPPSRKVFDKWNTQADGKGTSYAAGYSESKINATDGGVTILYAQWKSQGGGGGGSGGGGGYAPVTTTYTVTFDANGGEGSMSPQTFVSGKEKELPLNTFTREGFVFKGWAESADGDAVYVDGETVLVKKSQTLYAVWTELNPTVTPTAEPSGEPTGEPVPTEPGKSPAPVLGLILGGLAAAAVLRRK